MLKQKNNGFSSKIANNCKETIKLVDDGLNELENEIERKKQCFLIVKSQNENVIEPIYEDTKKLKKIDQILEEQTTELNRILFQHRTMVFIKRMTDPILPNHYGDQFFFKMNFETTIGKLIISKFDNFSNREIKDALLTNLIR